MSDAGSSLQYQRSQGSSPSLSDEMSVGADYSPEFNLGMRPEIRQLYRPNDQSTWAEWVPNDTREDVEAGSYSQECALIVRREPHPSNNNHVALHSITVQSPWLKKKLREQEQDPSTKTHLDLLHSILGKEILPHIEAMEDLTKNKVISFEYLWTIFSPGMLVYTQIDGQNRILLLRDSRYEANMSGEQFALECRYIDCDGTNFGYVAASLDVGLFDGVKKLADLNVIPAHLHPDVEDLAGRLSTRGEKVEQLNGFHHMSYSGFYTARSSRQVRKRHVESSRIIIDPHTFNIYGMPGSILEPIEPDSPVGSAEDGLFGGNVIYQATGQGFRHLQKVLETHRQQHKTASSSHSKRLSPKQRLLCTPVVRGYCLTSKNWAEFYVDNISPICWRDDAFTKLVLPHNYKDIIHAFVQEQLSRDDDFDDIIYGKGRGFIMLLSGEPGVGKTLTAESGELGETASEVEDSLDLVLELTNKWTAILLLDECDLFLQARTTSDITRNRLISIFLRKLEYYRGVMFLTTNRISDFDPAFESRIHLTIHYPALDIASRLHIWKTFIDMGKSGNRLTDENLATLAQNEMNGRQIKNIVKTARLLSKQKGVPLNMAHIELVLKVKKGDFSSV
ncbi:P-loop containing nucleoside triphosphate hydrolase protein [Xylariales sp. AK1849]|nr:P-loop containing nucleoside triphosphate hydrolase protein [Xylariales sp. AK1849]